MPIATRSVAFLLLCSAIFASQSAYDSSRARLDLAPQLPSVESVKAFNLGLHSATASFLWLQVRTELPFLRQGPEHFLSGLKLVNDLDPRWNTPYAFTVLVLPNVPSYRERISATLEIGERGLAFSDPDWRIPFYIGTTYQLELRDHKNAVRYFDLAAATPGVPELIRRFAINFGIHPDSLEATKQAWAVIYETSEEPTVRERAAAHIVHLELLESLNGAVRDFRKKNGRYPADLEEVVRAGILPGIPEDPFGFKFKIYERGVVGIAP